MRRFVMTFAILALVSNVLAGGGSNLVGNLEAGKQQTLIVYGTSLTAGGAWVGQLQKAFDERYPGLATLINSGKGGMWSKWGADNLDTHVIQKKPDTVLIEFAINDAYLDYKTSVAEARSNLTNMIDRILASKPETEIVLMTMNPPIGVHLERRPRIKDYYQMYRDVAIERNLLLIDHYTNWEPIREKDSALFAKYVPDGIHPGPEGCTRVITPAILKGLGIKAESQPSLVSLSKPNILLIMADDCAKQALSCYGNKDIETPALDRIAKEGMRFEHALTPNSFCTPSRAAVLTGKYSHKNGVTHLNQPFDGSQPTFPKVLQKAGYETSLFGKWHLLTQPTGFDHYCVMKMQGMTVDPIVFEPQHKWVVWGPKTVNTYLDGGRRLKGYNNDVITTEALNWLKNRRDKSKPFCMLLHPKPPHEPYHPPKKYEDFLKDVTVSEPATLLDDYTGRTPEAIAEIMTDNRIILGPSFQKRRKQLEKENPGITRDELTRAMYQEYIKGYYRLVKSVDDNVGRVLDYLEKSGLDKNTLVLYTSDQGFSLGEHGFYNKQWMYEPSLHQPLLVRLPRVIQAGSVHSSMVNHVDLAPTLLDFAGLPIPSDMQGYSLKPILEGKGDKVRDASYYHFYTHGARLPEMIGVRTERYKLIHYPGMKGIYQWELFDLEKDRDEMYNLYSNPEQAAVKERLKKQLQGLIKGLNDPVVAPGLVDGAL